LVCGVKFRDHRGEKSVHLGKGKDHLCFPYLKKKRKSCWYQSSTRDLKERTPEGKGGGDIDEMTGIICPQEKLTSKLWVFLCSKRAFPGGREQKGEKTGGGCGRDTRPLKHPKREESRGGGNRSFPGEDPRESKGVNDRGRKEGMNKKSIV